MVYKKREKNTKRIVYSYRLVCLFLGSVTLFLEKPLKAKSIRVVFRCEEWEKKKEASTLFSVESIIWGTREGGLNH
jgi:hypothetical protein